MCNNFQKCNVNVWFKFTIMKSKLTEDLIRNNKNKKMKTTELLKYNVCYWFPLWHQQLQVFPRLHCRRWVHSIRVNNMFLTVNAIHIFNVIIRFKRGPEMIRFNNRPLPFKNRKHIVNSPVPIRHLWTLEDVCTLFLNCSFQLQTAICLLASCTSSKNFSDQHAFLRNW